MVACWAKVVMFLLLFLKLLHLITLACKHQALEAHPCVSWLCFLDDGPVQAASVSLQGVCALQCVLHCVLYVLPKSSAWPSDSVGAPFQHGCSQEAAEESKTDIQAALAGADLVFVTVSL